jgi:tRNA dimethylallyltransferase
LTGYHTLKLGLAPDRDQLYQRLDERSRRMFEGGLIEEVEAIRARGFPFEAKPFESHGYRQAVQLLRGELNLKEALFYAQRNTRNYAKRQITWFRREQGLVWLKGFGDAGEIRERALAQVAAFLTVSPAVPPLELLM